MSGEIRITAGFKFNLSTPERVTLSKLNELGKPTGQVNAGAINTRELADNSVTGDKLADDILNQINADAAIGNGSITTQKLANGSVTIDKLSPDLNRISRLFITPATVYMPVAGTIASILATFPGWIFADGGAFTTDLGSGTVLDLRDKFVICPQQDDAGTAKSNITGSLLQTGGNTTHTNIIGGNTGAVTLTAAQSGLPSHSHNYFTHSTGGASVGNLGDPTSTLAVSGTLATSTEGGTAAAASHAHTNPANTGTGTHINPFFALVIITYVGI